MSIGMNGMLEIAVFQDYELQNGKRSFRKFATECLSAWRQGQFTHCPGKCTYWSRRASLDEIATTRLLLKIFQKLQELIFRKEFQSGFFAVISCLATAHVLDAVRRLTCIVSAFLNRVLRHLKVLLRLYWGTKARYCRCHVDVRICQK